jgi:cell wall-associated NlpC family hydrolase
LTAHDRRLHAFRPDLADVRLSGKVSAERFVAGRPARVVVSRTALRNAPDMEAGRSTELLMGDAVLVFDEVAGWAWMQAERDGYVGYAEAAALGAPDGAATHVVSAPRTFLYREPDLRRAVAGELPMGAAVTVTGSAVTRGTSYSLLPSGEAIVSGHLRPVGEPAEDFVAVAETLLHTPYLWGGATPFGIDCSGLVQLSMRMTGRDVQRDTDMQEKTIGRPLEAGGDLSGLRRGDLVFWKGHVAIMTDAMTMIHANGHTMMVSHEGLRQAIARIGYLYGQPTGFRRP